MILGWYSGFTLTLISKDLASSSVHHGSAATNDLGVVLGIHAHLNLERLGLVVRHFGFAFLQANLGLGHGSGCSSDNNRGRLGLAVGNLNVHIESVHQFTNTLALLANNEPMVFEGNLDLKIDWNKLLESSGCSFTFLLFTRDANDVGPRGVTAVFNRSSLSTSVHITVLLNPLLGNLDLNVEVLADSLNIASSDAHH